MSSESTFIGLMRAIASDPAARGLNDDAAVLPFGNETLILTHDMMAQGVHWLPGADPADVAWKLLAVNLSDLAAKGAKPVGVLLGFTLGDAEWDRRFADGLRDALLHYGVSLLGGDTIALAEIEAGGGAGRSIGLTALGRATYLPVPSRAGAKAGDILYVTGTLGDASAGFASISSGEPGEAQLLNAFNRPQAQLDAGVALAPIAHAMMDVSDGLLLDALRMAQASGLALVIDLAAIPLSQSYRAQCGDTLSSRLEAASWGDDYQLLCAAPEGAALPVAATAVGRFAAGVGLSVCHGNDAVPLPASLGFEHR